MEVCSLDARRTPQYFYMYKPSESSCFGAAEQLSWESTGQHLLRCIQIITGSDSVNSPLCVYQMTTSRLSRCKQPPTVSEFVNAALLKSVNHLKRKNTAKKQPFTVKKMFPVSSLDEVAAWFWETNWTRVLWSRLRWLIVITCCSNSAGSAMMASRCTLTMTSSSCNTDNVRN